VGVRLELFFVNMSSYPRGNTKLTVNTYTPVN